MANGVPNPPGTCKTIDAPLAELLGQAPCLIPSRYGTGGIAKRVKQTGLMMENQRQSSTLRKIHRDLFCFGQAQ
ncbi:hypothetical protein D9M71_696790 [compost metagenome]